MRNNHAIVINAKGKQIGDCFILVVQCLTVIKTIMRALEESSEDYHSKCSHLVINFIKGKICVPWDIINLVKDVNKTL